MSNTSLEDAKKVIHWIQTNQGFWNSDLLEIKESKLGGIGVFAKKDIEPTLKPELLLRLPKDSIFSAKKSSIANLLYEENLDGALALIIAFIYENHFGENSPWFEYLKTIIYKDQDNELILPPSLWTKSQKSLLKGSELEILGSLDDEENKSAYETACTFALNQNEISSSIPIPWEFDIQDKEDQEIFEKYKNFIAISHAIASRDFEIDSFHQVAMVPGADLFNHTNKPHVRFESVFDVCEMCGSAGPCDCIESEGEEDDEDMDDEEMSEEDDNEEGEDEEDNDNEEEGEGNIQEQDPEELSEHSDHEHSDHDHDDEESDSEPEDSDVEENRPIDEQMISKIEAALELEKQEELKQKKEQEHDSENKEMIMENDAGGKIFPDECCDIVLMKKVSKGEEIFNTYGDFNNSILLSKYGFVIPDNSDESINLGLECLKLKKTNKKLYSKQFEWWESKGYELMREFFNLKKNNCCDDEDCDDDHGNDDHKDDGCKDACCGGEGELPEGVEEIPNWTLEVNIDSTGEPNQLTYALCKLLSLNKLELNKFLKNQEKGLQVLTTNNSKAFKILKELLTWRLNQYDSEIKYEKLLKSKNYREKLIAQLIIHEQNIIKKSLQNISKKV
ncbi:hypothetical protein BN7_5226 [Wickerhamomyces ciferrii]|uniref:SET domain-containing protein n=1 Tax=Wickerhamomyces ciferrii (strain ATCC 14091 / BCRC 22168 / CBS 111 / JCM 3599 / NBRC 0793 / NRRL Y-1031 F-60-10) TaxID=1206466 RepID=K0KR57_WICCF|nr:uncharacterized protein BN7_5226 [Wickerhamomyces ciferrii]CCH45641.1 hypothetical protein BN7_5226 [Wickerhamomyces ciferrii]